MNLCIICPCRTILIGFGPPNEKTTTKDTLDFLENQWDFSCPPISGRPQGLILELLLPSLYPNMIGIKENATMDTMCPL